MYKYKVDDRVRIVTSFKTKNPEHPVMKTKDLQARVTKCRQRPGQPIKYTLEITSDGNYKGRKVTVLEEHIKPASSAGEVVQPEIVSSASTQAGGSGVRAQAPAAHHLLRFITQGARGEQVTISMLLDATMNNFNIGDVVQISSAVQYTANQVGDNLWIIKQFCTQEREGDPMVLAACLERYSVESGSAANKIALIPLESLVKVPGVRVQFVDAAGAPTPFGF